MTPGDTLVAVVARPYRGEPSRHYIGLAPMEPGERDARERMPIARVLVLETRPDGIFLDRFDESGEDSGDTWHESVDDAKSQAVAEYGHNLGVWTDVPAGEDDPVAFALRLAQAGH
jgi:hypothetical protein